MLPSKRIKIILKAKPASTSIGTQSSTSATMVAENDDLLMEILVRLPIKSILKFKSVSKHWLSLISNPQFSHLCRPFPISASGLFLRSFSILNNKPKFTFIDLSPNSINFPSRAPFEFLSFVSDTLGIKILQSCSGLLLCSISLPNPRKTHYYIYNPTTKQYSILPPLKYHGGFRNVLSVSLAFDPSKSPHYKVVCVRRCGFSFSSHGQIEIYSFQNGPWRVSSCYFTASVNVEFHRGVFCNGAVHWLNNWEKSLFFKVDEEEVRDMPMPSTRHDWDQRTIEYFGESRDHLHLIEIYGPRTLEFNAYEMKMDYSGWFLKYHVDLNAVPISFPDMISEDLQPGDWNYYKLSILSLIRAKENDSSFLVLNILGKLVRYSFEDKSFQELLEIAGTESSIMHDWFQAYQYIENLCCP